MSWSGELLVLLKTVFHPTWDQTLSPSRSLSMPVMSEKPPHAGKGQDHPVAGLTNSHENQFLSTGKALVLLGKDAFHRRFCVLSISS